MSVPLISEIQSAVCRCFDVTYNDLVSERRARHVARPRQVAMFLAREMTPRSLPEIGRRFGDRDHTTVMHAIRAITKLSANDPELVETIDQARRMIGGLAAIRMRGLEQQLIGWAA